MLELYQAEWCPHSHKVRQRLTELGIDFLARQVPADPEDRHALRRLSRTTEIPVLVSDDGAILRGEDEILAYLDVRAREREDAGTHRDKAAEKVGEFGG